MDLHLDLQDPAVMLPALLVTLLAVLAARALFGRTSAASSSTSSAAEKKRSVGYGDEPPPSRALAEPAPVQKVRLIGIQHLGHRHNGGTRTEPNRAWLCSFFYVAAVCSISPASFQNDKTV